MELKPPGRTEAWQGCAACLAPGRLVAKRAACRVVKLGYIKRYRGKKNYIESLLLQGVSTMNAYLRNHMAAVFLSLPVAAAMVVLPTAVMARTAAPELRSLKISSDGGLSTGAELGFTVEGTAGAKSHVRIDGVKRDIILKETSRGLYTGSYTVMGDDRISQTSPIRAIMQVGNLNIVANYTFPVGMGTVPLAEPLKEKAKAKDTANEKEKVDTLKIGYFNLDAVTKLEPGAELHFVLKGSPDSQVNVVIPGISKKVSMREASPGVYEATYTLRKQDKPKPTSPIVVILSQGKNSLATKLNSWGGDTKAPVILKMLPREGSDTTKRSVIVVSGSFDEKNGVGVDTKSVRFLVSGRDVTARSKITKDGFSYRANLKPGRHMADVTVSDLSGNKMHKTWMFNVVEPSSSSSSKNERCD